MQNPFEQFLPEKDSPQDKIKEEVMGNIHLKSYLINILELFTAIFGITMTDQISAPSSANESTDNPTDLS